MLERFKLSEFPVISFDIFDTLITRPFLKPTYLFHEVAARAYALGWIDNNLAQFQADRIKAEKKAREYSSSEDVTLDEIYSFLEGYHNKKQIQQLEIETEIELVVPIKENIEKFNTVVEQGQKVIIVSDMYLSSSVLLKMLSKTNLILNDVKIFVSNEYGLTKRSGNLFRAILEIENLNSKDILHIGNDRKADYYGARKFGIRCLLYKQWLPTKEEKNIKYKILSLGVSRAVRLSTNQDQLTRIYSDIVAPFLYDYVDYILKDAIHKNISNIFFLSRDAQIYYKIAKTIVNNKKLNINLKYIYASRNSWASASIFNFCFEDLKWVVVDNQDNKISDLISRLELYECESSIFSIFDKDLNLDLEVLNEFIKYFKGSNVEEIALKKSKKSREGLISYLYANNFIEENTAIVDIGWRLNMLVFLKKILENSGFNIKINGYYLGLNNGHIMDYDVLNNTTCYIKHPLAESTVKSFFKDVNLFRLPSIMILEHVFSCSDHPSLKRINFCDENGFELVFSKQVEGDFFNKVTYVHSIVEKYSNLYSSLDNNTYCGVDEKIINFKKVKRFIFIPTYLEVDSLNFVLTNKDISHDDKYNEKIAEKMSFSNFLGLKSSGSWFYGSIALSNILIRFIIFPLLILKVIK